MSVTPIESFKRVIRILLRGDFKFFRLRNAAIGRRAGQTDSTPVHRRQGSAGNTPSRLPTFVIFREKIVILMLFRTFLKPFGRPNLFRFGSQLKN